MGQLRGFQGSLRQVGRGQLWLWLDLAGEKGRRIGGHRQHGRRWHPADHRRQSALDRGRVGTCLLHRLPQYAPQVC